MNRKTIFIMTVCFIGLAAITQLVFAQKPVLIFSAEPCHPGQYTNSNTESVSDERTVISKTWVTKNYLFVVGSVTENCGAEISGGDYEIYGDNLILEYTAEGNLADCFCKHTLTYLIKNLPNKEYEISLDRVGK